MTTAPASKVVPVAVRTWKRPLSLAGELGDLLAQMKLGVEGLDLLHQPIDQLLGAAHGQRRNVVDRLIRIELGALAARMRERVDDVRADTQQAELEDLEQAAGSCADDDDVGADRLRATGRMGCSSDSSVQWRAGIVADTRMRVSMSTNSQSDTQRRAECRAARRLQFPARLRRPRRERRTLGRRGTPLHRLRERHLRAQYGAPASEGQGRALRSSSSASRTAASRSRRTRATSRLPSAERARARPDAEENDLPLDRRRGGGERHQDRALPHAPLGAHRILGRLPRPHARLHQPHRQGACPTRRASGRCCPRSITCPSRLPITASPSRTRLTRSSSSSRRISIRRASPRSSSSRCWAKAASTTAPAELLRNAAQAVRSARHRAHHR